MFVYMSSVLAIVKPIDSNMSHFPFMSHTPTVVTVVTPTRQYAAPHHVSHCRLLVSVRRSVGKSVSPRRRVASVGPSLFAHRVSAFLCCRFVVASGHNDVDCDVAAGRDE